MTTTPPAGTMHALAIHLVEAIQPLDAALRDPEAFRVLMYQLGWQVDGLPPQYVAVADQVFQAAQALRALPGDPSAQEILDLVVAAGDVYKAVTSLTEAPPGVDPAAFLPEIGRRLFEFLLARHLLAAAPRWFATLRMLGVIAFEDTPAANGRPAFVRLRFDWDQIPAILADPGLIPTRLYGWGTPTFEFARLSTIIGPLLQAMGVPVSLILVGRDHSAALQSAATAPPAGPVKHAITMPLFDLPINGTYGEVGFLLAGLPAEGDALPGLILQINAPAGLTETVDLGGGWTFVLRAGTDLAEQLAVVVRPGETFVRYPFARGRSLPAAGLGMSLAYRADTPTVLFGQAGQTRLELGSAALDLSVDEKAGEVAVSVGTTVDGLALVVATGDQDGFLARVLGGGEVRVPLRLAVSWSSRTGLNFQAGAGFATTVYPHLDLAALRIDRVDLAVGLASGPGAPRLDIRVLVSFSGSLGPVSFAVEGVGAALTARLADGNAGPFDLAIDPVRPTGLGLSIDAGPVHGGGFISYDPDHGRYTGILMLDIFDIGLTVIGLLDTRDDTGAALAPPGYSLLLVVAADLPPIQLGWGFTLNSVGGIAALNRRLDSTAMLAAIRQGGLASLLFPKNPVRDATTVVAGLRALFPIAAGRHVFGPTAVIGWGSPTLITIQLAVVVEMPAPITLTLLGMASVVLPDADAPIVELHIDVIGVYDAARKTIAIDASLHDSRIAGFALSGDLAMRLRWGDHGTFVIAVGGFNPQFAGPPGFPALRRVTVALGTGANPRISLEGYLAVTSNSRQLGAKAELYASAGGFNVHGWLSFDALITLHPFAFRFDFSIGMSLNHGSHRIAGITVSGTLTGPSPFHVWGEGSLSALFFDITVPFEATFGLGILTSALAAADPWPLLSAAITQLENWSGDVIARRGVSLTSTTAGPLLDPASAATMRQRVVPLARPLQKFGEHAIGGADTYTVTRVSIGDQPAGFHPVIDVFAPGDFEQLSATDQLSRDAFEPMQAGVRIGEAITAPADEAKVAEIAYQTKIIDSSWRVRTLPPTAVSLASQLAAVQTGAAGTARRARFARRNGRTAGVVLDDEAYTVARTDTLAPRTDMDTAMAKGAALAALRRAGGAGLQVLPRHETEPFA